MTTSENITLSRYTPGARRHFERIDWGSTRGAAHIRGFNYQPSWAASGFKTWVDQFDAKKYRAELENGKRLFPGMNTVRIWLHYGAWRIHPEAMQRNVSTALAICRDLDLLVMPVLTSNWGLSMWGLQSEDPASLPGMDAYFLAMDEASAGGANILAWDVCNEPYVNVPVWDGWLRERCALVREKFATGKVTFGAVDSDKQLGLLDAVDLWSAHFYEPFMHNAMNPEEAARHRDELSVNSGKFHELIIHWMKETYSSANGGNKPVISNECCWGSLDDEVWATVVETSLKTFVEAGIGFLPHALQESLAPDLHRPEFGEVKRPGFMAFVLMDGSPRPGHDVFNNYVEPTTNERKQS